MEGIISKITNIYQKEKENKPKKDTPQKNEIKNLADKIYIINQKEIEEEQTLSTKKKEEFSNSLYDIPIKYLLKVLKNIFKRCNIKKDIKLLLVFLEKNKNKLTEKHILYIFKKIKDYNKNEIDKIIKYIIINIKFDDKYFLELLKEEEIELDKNIIDSLNNYLDDINDEDKMSFLNLIKTLNLISLLKEILNKKEYDSYEQKINKAIEEILNKKENCTELCDKEFNEDFNIEFINSMKIINSNPNKAYYIQEKIII